MLRIFPVDNLIKQRKTTTNLRDATIYGIWGGVDALHLIEDNTLVGQWGLHKAKPSWQHGMVSGELLPGSASERDMPVSVIQTQTKQIPHLLVIQLVVPAFLCKDARILRDIGKMD